MPEGDSVWRTARTLDRALADRFLVASDLRVPALATLDLAGALCRGTETHGKHLFTRFERDGRLLTLHSHLGMDGSWTTGGIASATTAGRAGRLDHRVRAVLWTEEHRVLGSSLKVLELLDPAAETSLRARLGPDLLDDGGSDRTALTAWQAATARQPERPFAETLLDQQVLAGLGTVFVSELGFLLGVAPHRPAATVPAERLVPLARRLLRSSVQRGRRVTTGDTRRGADLWVYGRERRSCRRCGTPIRRDRVGGAPTARSIWWCPSCQR